MSHRTSSSSVAVASIWLSSSIIRVLLSSRQLLMTEVRISACQRKTRIEVYSWIWHLYPWHTKKAYRSNAQCYVLVVKSETQIETCFQKCESRQTFDHIRLSNWRVWPIDISFMSYQLKRTNCHKWIRYRNVIGWQLRL